MSKADAAKRQADAAEKKRKAEEKARAEQQREEAKKQAKDEALRAFWMRHSEEERQRIEEEAIEAATEQQRRVIDRGGPLAKTMRKVVVDNYATRIMQVAA